MSRLLEQIKKAPRETKKFGDFFEIIDGDRGANYPSKSEFTKSGYCVFLNTKNVPSQGFDFSNADFISKERDELLRKGKLSRNDMVMTTRGTIGNVALYTEDMPFDCIRINSGMVILRAKPENDRLYLYTFIKSDLFNARLKNISSGSAQPQLPIKDLREIEIDMPDLLTQKKIAEILSAYDAKIKNNNLIIAKLESAAQVLFDEWFVKFHFPEYEKAKFVDSEMGEIPEGWSIGKVADLTDEMNSGGTPSTQNSDYYNGDIAWFSTKELQDNFLFDSEKKITRNGLDNSSAKIFPPKTIVMAIYAAPTVGRLGILSKESCFNQAAVGLVAKKSVGYEFIYLLLKSLRGDLNNMANGAAQQNLNVGIVKNYRINIPSDVVLEKFTKRIRPIFDQIFSLQKENICLKNQRDQLLAKLI